VALGRRVASGLRWAPPQRAGRSILDRGWPAACAVAAGAGVSVVVVLLKPADLSFWSVFAAFSALCALHVAGLRRRTAGAASDLLAPAPPFVLVLFVMFGLGSVYGWTGLDPLPEHPDPLPALVLATVGLGAFTVGYQLPFVRRTASLTWRLPVWRPRRALLAAALCLGIGLVGAAASFATGEYFAFTQADISVDVSSPLGFLEELLFVGVVILGVVAGSTMSRRRAQVLLLAVGAVLVALFLPTGHRFYLFLVLGSIAVPWHCYIRPIRFSWVVALGLFTILFVTPVGQLWRTEYGAGSYQGQRASGASDIPLVAAGVSQDLAAMAGGQYLDYTVQHFERLNEAATVAALMNTVPADYGYKYGQTYLPMVTWVIPRFFWPDKPTFQYFNEVGRETGLIAVNDYQTTVVYTSLGELYLNFGYVGVPIGMLALGALFRWLYQALMSGPRNPTAVLAYALLVFPFWQVEEALGPALGAALRDTVAGVLIVGFCGALDWRQRSAAGSLDVAAGSTVGSRS
jgi:hypothetical protein